ncbi:MAG: retropepsin-like aspartic protease [Gemmatimonadales bacterium]|jgi:hypothetical protein
MIGPSGIRGLCVAATIACGIPTAGTLPAQAPWWLDTLGYTPAELSTARVPADGFPYVPVRVDGTELWLLFDTGNMLGLSIRTEEYERLGLEQTGSWRRRNSSGDAIGAYRVGRAAVLDALGRSVRDVAVYEFRHPRLTGLLGPRDVPGRRFTLDYRAQVIAVSETPLPAGIGGHAIRLVRSSRHPRLVVVAGHARGETVLIELDTGKSRTVVDPSWAASVDLDVAGRDTVAVGDIQVGEARFHVTNAKPVSLQAVDPSLPAPLGLSLGSDTLARFVVTVDYGTGVVLLWEQGSGR